ncbi:MAG: recombinase family protein [Sphingomonas sp.]|nr:recombinase family protein [Sphingomonas sp.]
MKREETRSLADFAKMVELFDRHEVSFVSVTQAFNTTSSMGRLTLNVLLSFAQFEREVTGERIRDKIAASKARGMWMGGCPPLGYDPKERTLVVNAPEADLVRHIFRRYLELGNVNLLVVELEQQAIRSKCWTSRSGVVRGGAAFNRGALFHLLRNRLYLGEIVHKDRTYPGLHPAIVDRELFDAVQARLDSNRVTRRQRTECLSPLAGLVFDAEGHRMTPAHARGRGGRRYLYYVSAPLQEGRKPHRDTIRRVPGARIEAAVVDRLRRWTRQPDLGRNAIADHVTRVEVHNDALVIELAAGPFADRDPDAGPDERCTRTSGGNFRMFSPARFHRRGGRTWLTESIAVPRRARPDRTLIAGLRRAHMELGKRGIDLGQLRAPMPQARGADDPYIRKLVQLAFLAPDIQKAILEGRQPEGLTLADMLDMQIPDCWIEQRMRLGFAG